MPDKSYRCYIIALYKKQPFSSGQDGVLFTFIIQLDVGQKYMDIAFLSFNSFDISTVNKFLNFDPM